MKFNDLVEDLLATLGKHPTGDYLKKHELDKKKAISMLIRGRQKESVDEAKAKTHKHAWNFVSGNRFGKNYKCEKCGKGKVVRVGETQFLKKG